MSNRIIVQKYLSSIQSDTKEVFCLSTIVVQLVARSITVELHLGQDTIQNRLDDCSLNDVLDILDQSIPQFYWTTTPQGFKLC